MSISFATRRAEYAALWASMTIRPEHLPEVRAMARRILAGRPRYDGVSKATGVPWWLIGIMHAMECGLDFTKHLHNGDPLSKPTRNVPKGRGPFATWEESAIDAIRLDRLDQISDWTVEHAAYALESFNGFGYVRKGIPSPYLWSFTSHYAAGKFVADGAWSPTAVSKQCGGMALLKLLVELEPTHVDIDAGVRDDGPTFPKVRLPEPTPVAVEAARSKTGWSILTGMALTVVAQFKSAVEWVKEVVLATVDLLPTLQHDVDSGVGPIKSLGAMLGANVTPIISTVTLVLLVVAYARHIRDRRELNNLRQRVPQSAAPAPMSGAGSI